MVEQFCFAIHDFLMFYQHQMNDISSKVLVRRQHEAAQLFNCLESGDYGPTMLEVKVMVAPLLR